jgi:hypothetical protein
LEELTHRQTKPGVHRQTMTSEPQADISTLPGTGHFYLALTPLIRWCHGNAMSGLSKVEMSGTLEPQVDGAMETGMSQQELKRVETCVAPIRTDQTGRSGPALGMTYGRCAPGSQGGSAWSGGMAGAPRPAQQSSRQRWWWPRWAR